MQTSCRQYSLILLLTLSHVLKYIFCKDITLVLALHKNDIERALVLFDSLQLHQNDCIHSLIVLVPDLQLYFIRSTFDWSSSFLFPVYIYPDSMLIDGDILANSYPYAIQMSLKLLVAKIIQTDFYLTLDADVLLLQPINSSMLIINNKAIYEHEPRLLHHPDWWTGSEHLLNITHDNPSDQGFSVTPALLSTQGSLLTLKRIQQVMTARLNTPLNSPHFDTRIVTLIDLCMNIWNKKAALAYNIDSDSNYAAESEQTFMSQCLWLTSLGRPLVGGGGGTVRRVWSEVWLCYSYRPYVNVLL